MEFEEGVDERQVEGFVAWSTQHIADLVLEYFFVRVVHTALFDQLPEVAPDLFMRERDIIRTNSAAVVLGVVEIRTRDS